MRKYKWIRLLVGGLIIASMAACSPAPSSSSSGIDTTPQPDTLVVTPTVSTHTVIPLAQPLPPATSTRLWAVVPITQTQSGGIEEKPIMSSVPIPTPLDQALQQIVTQARENLAKRLGVGIEQVGPGEAQAVDWPDTSLGCPQPGMAYAQVITPGYRIILTAEGKTYEYHGDTQRRVVYCEPIGARPLLGGEPTESVRRAKEDLAQRLGVSVNSITVNAVIGQEFSVDAFNCRTSKERIARDESQAVISGQSILLSASGRRYEYHASGQTVIFCRPLP